MVVERKRVRHIHRSTAYMGKNANFAFERFLTINLVLMASRTFRARFNDPRPIVAVGSIEHAVSSRTHDRIELVVLQAPLLLEEAMHAFVEAGAELIFTPTARASRLWLEQLDRADRVYELNRKAVWIARKAAAQRAFVAGIIGPPPTMLQPIGPLNTEHLRRAIAEQAIALLDGGCDTLVLKSFIEVDELVIALETVLPLANTTPVIALKAFPEDAAVLATSFPADIARMLSQYSLAAIGASGTVGPQRMRGVISAMRSGSTLPLVALPDTGIPTMVNGRTQYSTDADYIARTLRGLAESGAHIIGTDRGTTTAHTAATSQALAGNIVVAPPQIPIQRDVRLSPRSIAPPPSRFAQNLRERFVITVELDIPRGLDMASVLEGARYLRMHGVDAVNISDGARARLRVNSLMLSAYVQQETGIECIAHLACRDRNMVALQSDLLGAAMLGVQNILAVSGDPTHIGDFPRATTVGDLDSIGLIRALRMMNSGRDLAGNPLGGSTNFCIACACNPCAEDIERELDRIAQKVAEGAEAIFTQPMFDLEQWLQFLDRAGSLPARFIVGILPLRSLRHAEFLHYEVPGMTIPAWVRKRIAMSPNPAEEGITIAAEFLAAVKERCHGVYLMPPFKKYEVVLSVLERAGVASVCRENR